MASSPMFPLGSVLFPHMPLGLRLFEPRYLTMLGHLLDTENPVFGVVLIERGQEVGGGDTRFDVGTMARIVRVDSAADAMGVLAQGTRRFRVVEWLPDDPYPRAEIEFLPDLQWDPGLRQQRADAEAAVREVLGLAGGEPVPEDIGLSADPVESAWQLAGLLPINPMDRQEILGSASTAHLLSRTEQAGWEAAELLASGRG